MCDACPPQFSLIPGRGSSCRGSRAPSRQASRTSMPGGSCGIHPRPDCCRIPCCKPPLPKCPLGIYVEKVQPIRPDLHYEPPTFPFDGMSHYREQYFLKCAERTKSMKPIAQFDPSCAKMDGLSTYREAYVPKQLNAYEKPPWAVQARFDPSCAKMDGITTYRNDYAGCMTERVKSMKPLSDFDPSCAKMEGISTYRYNYIPYCPREYAYAKLPLMKQNPTPSFSCAPMEGATTYRMDYFPKCAAKRRSMKPVGRPGFSDAKLDGITTYRNDYFPFHFQRCPEGPCIPAQIYDQMYPQCGMMACQGDTEITSTTDDYGGCCGGPVNIPGTCGDAQGLFNNCPPPPVNGNGDC